MRAETDIYNTPEHPMRPMWMPYFWAVSFWVVAMITLMMVVSNYAALWAIMLVGGSAVLAATYWAKKNPLPM
jgi:hypothetical protein